jgi:orotate phosphoribosyltransferase
MTDINVKEILENSDAFLSGHFLLSSGLHSDSYVQCAKLMSHPDLAQTVIGVLTDKLKGLEIDVVCGPALGAVNVSYELARQLGKISLFTERVEDQMALRRGFTITPGQKVIIAEDVITTGKSTLETVEVLLANGAEVIGVACIVDRTGGENPFRFPIYSALELEIHNYLPDDCLLCKEGEIPLVKPGSRAV